MTPASNRDGTRAPVSAAILGGTLATLMWTAGWWATLLLAARQLRARPGAWAALGLATSLAMSLVGVRLTRRHLRSSHRAWPEPATAERWPRRVLGWFALVFWGGAGLMWNVGITGVQLRLAAGGQGGALTVLVLWSAIGLFLSSVLMIGLGHVIDAGLNLVRRPTATR